MNISDKSKISFSSFAVFISAMIGFAGGVAWLATIWATLQPLPLKIERLEGEVAALKSDSYDTCRGLEIIQKHTVPREKQINLNCYRKK